MLKLIALDMKKIFGFLFGLSIRKNDSLEKSNDSIHNSKEDLIRTLERLYKCRDLEISNLWQRSVFLSAFLVLCFTGYGYLLIQIIDSNTTLPALAYYHVVAIALGGVNFVFSLLWIMMAKGSKAWYEVYEVAITAFSHKHYEKIGLPEENIMGEMGVPFNKLDNNILSRKAGAYSVSKINIVIGQLCMCLWALIAIAHFCFLLTIKFGFTFDIIYCIIFSVLFLILTALVSCYVRKKCISGHLYDTIYGDEGEQLCERK
ncbi:hypothetical protein [uncultured Bacteroides sp.]|uniref:RipA family octameric membrane protein n=1 Tax=uncultured Bacteroides sp. TaxID=162156 RepID=UPI0025EBA570|nr:hypothetical protein [uncultured Bacteroides sp.]